MTTFMEGETSWESYSINYSSWESYAVGYLTDQVQDYAALSGPSTGDEEEPISLESLLPDEILEKIFSCMPIACIIRMSSVSKRWCEVVHSRRSSWSSNLPQKPWYFMFTSSDSAKGHAYDPSVRKWHNVALPFMDSRNWSISSSHGLVCYMDNESRSTIFVSNPITRDCKRLQESPPGENYPDYCALAMAANPRCNGYTVAIAKSKQVPGDFLRWEFSIHVYGTKTVSWVTYVKEVLVGWRGGDESVICNGTFYCLIYATGVVGNSNRRHALIMYDLLAPSPPCSVMQTSILVPCSLTCGRLMNLKDRLVMVGGIGKPERPDIIKGIGIWELCGKEWREIARMPHRFFQGFGEFDDVFASSGTDDFIYIQSYGAPALLIYNIAQRQWKWSMKCPVTKRFPLQLFTGFCFEPRLEVSA